MDVFLVRTPEGLIPAGPQDFENLERIKLGATVRADVKQPRNVQFHRKFFALLNFAFDCWEPVLPDHKGMQAQKNFERFREDVTIAAGWYEIVVNIQGETRAKAKSISFGSMDELEFEKLYSAAINVVLSRILKNYTREDLDRVVEETLRFASNAH